VSYHKDNFGKFEGIVSRYADLDGYVPESGDSIESFRWEDAPVDWDAWCKSADDATRQAQSSVAEWRTS